MPDKVTAPATTAIYLYTSEWFAGVLLLQLLLCLLLHRPKKETKKRYSHKEETGEATDFAASEEIVDFMSCLSH